jgi:hypothetical protein
MTSADKIEHANLRCQAAKDEPIANPDMELKRWAAQLPAWGDYGTQKLFVFEKR